MAVQVDPSIDCRRGQTLSHQALASVASEQKNLGDTFQLPIEPVLEKYSERRTGSQPSGSQSRRTVSRELVRKICEPFFEEMLDDLEVALAKAYVTRNDKRTATALCSIEAHRNSQSASRREGEVDSSAEKDGHAESEQRHALNSPDGSNIHRLGSSDRHSSKMSSTHDTASYAGRAVPSSEGNSAPRGNAVDLGEISLASSATLSPKCRAPKLLGVKPTYGKSLCDEAKDGPGSMPAVDCDKSGGSSQSLEKTREAASSQKARKLCYFWKKKGWCKFQDSCKFSHTEHMCGAKAVALAPSIWRGSLNACHDLQPLGSAPIMQPSLGPPAGSPAGCGVSCVAVISPSMWPVIVTPQQFP